MQVFLITPTGEEGPFTPAQMNRMHAQGKVKHDQPCRVEGVDGTKPIREVFRHFAPSAEVAVTAKKQVAAYNRSAGNSSISTGTIMVGIGIFCIFFFNPMNVGFGLFFVGFGLIGRGAMQARQGEREQAKLQPEETRASFEEAFKKPDESKSEPSGKKFEY